MAGKGAPKHKVKSQAAPKRGKKSSKITASWGAAKEEKGYPVEGYDVLFHFNGKKKDSDKHRTAKSSDKSEAYTMGRKNWYPYAGKQKLLSVSTKVRPFNKNDKKKERYGPYHSATTLKFEVPDKPKISHAVNIERGEITFAVVSEDPGGKKEREDSVIVVKRRGTGGDKELFNARTTSEAWSKTFDIEDSKTLTQTQWIEVSCNAYARGFRGDSEAAKPSTRVFSWPRSGVIDSISIQSVNSANKTGMVVLSVSLAKIKNAKGVDQSSMHPVDTVQLQRLRNSSAKTPAQAAVAEGWTDVSGAVDDGECKGLTDQLSDAYPDPGTRTWYRLKTTHDDYTVYGDPKDLGVYQNPDSLVLSNVVIFDTSASNGDGESVIVYCGWNSNDATGVEISWSEHDDAWRSSTPPSKDEITWDDGPKTVDGVQYAHSASYVIRSLTDNKPYFVQARTYVTDADDKTLYGAYCTAKTLIPTSSPKSVTLNAPMFIARGDDLILSWTFDSSGTQTQYIVYDNAQPSPKTWASGANALGSCVIPAADLEGIDELYLAVSMTTGGDWVSSATQYVEENGETVLKDNVFQHIVITDPPTCSVAMSGTIATQPIVATVTSDSSSARVVMSLTCVGGGFYDYPEKTAIQADGDVIWSDSMDGISWEPVVGENEEISYVAPIVLPDGLELFDGDEYMLTATVVDDTSGLASQESTATASVVWAHQAVEPSATISVDPENYTVAIATEAPEEGYGLGDVCEVYRVTPDNVYRITPVDGVAFGTVVTDRLAPFVYEDLGQAQVYRVALRTIDGDVEYVDVPYTLYGWALRFDWGEDRVNNEDGEEARGGQFVELPFNISVDDSFNNNFEARTHLNGVTEGYWGEGVEHTSSMKTDLIRFNDPEQRHLVMRGMIRHAGPIFLRQPNGCAYAANVIPRQISESYDSQVLGVSLDAQEIALTDEYRPDEKDIDRPEWNEGSVVIFRGNVYDADGEFPLYRWEWLGRSESLVDYVMDPESVIRTVDGNALEGWTWNGEAIVSEDGTTTIPLSKEV